MTIKAKTAKQLQAEISELRRALSEARETLEAIRHREESRGFVLLPLHGELPPTDQDAAVGDRKAMDVVIGEPAGQFVNRHGHWHG